MSEKILSYKEALLRAAKYCALQERCAPQMKKKFKDWGVDCSVWDQLLHELSVGGYFSEERFAKAFARGKFNSNGWGKVKIVAALRQFHIDEALIETALREIDPDQYTSRLNTLLQRKAQSLTKGMDPYIVRQKLSAFALSKGYHTGEIINVLKQIIE